MKPIYYYIIWFQMSMIKATEFAEVYEKVFFFMAMIK